jgi:hypothetical protein
MRAHVLLPALAALALGGLLLAPARAEAQGWCDNPGSSIIVSSNPGYVSYSPQYVYPRAAYPYYGPPAYYPGGYWTFRYPYSTYYGSPYYTPGYSPFYAPGYRTYYYSPAVRYPPPAPGYYYYYGPRYYYFYRRF